MSPERKLNCGTCTACCRNNPGIFLHPQDGDIPENYVWVSQYNPLRGELGMLVDTKENGDCIYLTDKGCGIYSERPAVCRSYDCRINYLSLTRKMRDHCMPQVLQDAAKARMSSMPSELRRRAIAKRKQLEAGDNVVVEFKDV